jgi:hypothetical protein
VEIGIRNRDEEDAEFTSIPTGLHNKAEDREAPSVVEATLAGYCEAVLIEITEDWETGKRSLNRDAV